MGIYLGQLPPAEFARFKAELAETLVANFCYPRFFDHRTESLQMRPVDRNKRQEIWLYLSSYDFTPWSRVDLMSADLQHQIERLFIQFVQRNRSFFGEQGRRRMSDIRMLIGSCAGSVAQGLRRHLTGQKQPGAPFGSPRPVLSWTATPLSKRAEPTWEQISAQTALLQQQLQEWRGEIKPGMASDGRLQTPVAASSATSDGRRATHPQPTPPPLRVILPSDDAEFDLAMIQQPTMPTPPISPRSAPAAADTTSGFSAQSQPAATTPGTIPPAPVRASGPLAASIAPPINARVSGSHPTPVASPIPARPSGPLSTATPSTMARKAETPVPPPTTAHAFVPPASSAPGRGVEGKNRTSPLPESVAVGTPTAPQPARSTSSPVSANLATNTGQREVLSVGEDDLAIFEEMRHQLLIWLRVEAVTAGLEINGQGPAQLLDLLRLQTSMDETRLQVVSTLLNLANQVAKSGTVGVMDYKQALMFHLMHTKRF